MAAHEAKCILDKEQAKVQVAVRKGHCIEPIIRVMNGRFSLNDDGKVHCQGMPDTFLSPLYTMLDLDPDPSGSERHACISDAVWDAYGKSKGKPLGLKELIFALKKRVRLWQAQPTDEYAICSRISIDRGLLPKATMLRHAGCNIALGADLSKYICAPQKLLSLRELQKQTPANYSTVKATTKARSEAGAYRRAEKSLHYILGIMNWACTFMQHTYSIGGIPGPIIPIIFGPIMTVHPKRGGEAARTVWYEQMRELGTGLQTQQRWDDTMDILPKIRIVVRRGLHSDFLVRVFQEYYSSLNHNDHKIGFLNLWRILECLTNPMVGTKCSQDQHVSRVVFLYKDTRYHKAVLAHLRDSRNRWAHGMASLREDGSQLLYDLKAYVDLLLRRWVFSWSRLPKEDIVVLLNGPSQLKDIIRRQRILDMAIPYGKARTCSD